MFLIRLLTLVLFLSLPAKTPCQDLLKFSDVHAIMQQMLDHHVNKHEMSQTIIQSAINNYIDQFDTERIYLLSSEVSLYQNLPATHLNQALDQYQHDQFALFLQLNQTCQNAIARARTFRLEIETKKKQELFQLKDPVGTFNQKVFASTVEEVKKRQFDYLKGFIVLQKERFGAAATLQMKDQILQSFEARMKEFENQYLYVSSQGEPLSNQEQENLFCLHILKAFASSLDSHSSFYEDSEAYDLRLRLKKEFEGIGLILKDAKDGVTVIRMFEGGPAAKSGKIKEGDILVALNDEPVGDLPFQTIMEKLHGDKNTDVKLTLKRKEQSGKNDEFSVTLNRDKVILKKDRVDVSSEPFGNGILGKIALHAFYQGEDLSSEEDVRKAILDLKAKGNLRGLILDLRDNSGGFLSQAVKVAGLFITNGVIVISKYSNGDEHYYRDVDGKQVYDGPLVVLTSKATASAAEIVAQALQDYGVALVVGDEHTYGKGTIQTQTVTDNQSSSYFKVTVGMYYTVSGHTPQKQGVKADVVVPSHWSREKIGELDPAALEGQDIPSAFDDELSDIPPEKRGWYLKYYTPKIQHKLTTWRALLPVLKKNSESRIANNKNYQYYLKGGSDEEDDSIDQWSGLLDGKKKVYGEDDLQSEEALNILKDMVILQRKQTTP